MNNGNFFFLSSMLLQKRWPG